MFERLWAATRSIAVSTAFLALFGCSRTASTTASSRPDIIKKPLMPEEPLAVPPTPSIEAEAETNSPPPPEVPLQVAEEPAEVSWESEAASRQLLRWTLHTGESLRFMASVTQQGTSGRLTFENQRHFTYGWRVADVSDKGFATLVVTFESLRLNLTHPPLFFDSLTAQSSGLSSNDPRATEELDAARALLDSQIVAEISPTGEITDVVGSSLDDDHLFLPADFPILAGERVGPLDSWRIPVVSIEDPHRVVRKTECKFEKRQDIGARTIFVLRERSEPASGEASNGKTDSGPRLATTIARFDAVQGRFLTRLTTDQLESRLPDGERQTIVRRIAVQLLPMQSGPVER